MVPLPKAAPVDASVDPLIGISGLSLFPRSIRDAPTPADSKDLNSIQNVLKSLKELRSPEKLMSEAKKIVDGGADLLSNISSFAENVSVINDVAAKAKDRPQERRQGLGIARKKGSFSLKTSISYPPVKLDPTLDMDRLQDADAFFDAYERNENAKKEIQKQLGVGKENIDLYKPLNNERRRRPGILGHRKSFNYKHRYSSTPSENDDMLMFSQETVYQDIPSPPKDVSPEKLIDPDPNLDDLEEVEMAESMKETESQVSGMLKEMYSYDDDDLEGDGALNILQERLNIKTLDLKKLYCPIDLPDIGRTNILTSPGSREKPSKSSAVLDSVVKTLNKKPFMEQELVENPDNPVSSATPPRNPFGSISLLKKKILQPNPLRDPFSAEDIDLCVQPYSSPVHPKDKVLELVDTPKELDMSYKLDSHVESAHTEPLISDMDSHNVMGGADNLPEQSQSEKASMEREGGSSRENASPFHIRDTPVVQVSVPMDLGMFSEMESDAEFNTTTHPLCHFDAQKVIGNADGRPEHFEDVNASIPNMDANSTQNEDTDNSIEEAMNTNDKESNPSVVDDEARDDASTRVQTDPEQQELHAAKQQRAKRVAGEKRTRDASTRGQADPEQQELHAAKQQRGNRVAGGKRIRDAHPMRKSLAEAGTSFETGVRRSKRVRTRPLEYWKGERFLYERVGESLKLIGLKYISPGKANENLKVKPYEELLNLASRP